MADKIYSLKYHLCGCPVKLNFNSQNWLERLGEYLCLPRGTGEPSGLDMGSIDISSTDKSLIEMNLIELAGGQEELDQALLLPGEEFLQEENILLLNIKVPYRVYIKGTQRWVDYSGYGRSWVDHCTGTASFLLHGDSGVHPGYTCILFGLNLLSGLLLKENFVSIHASGVVVGGKGILFTGHSGRGKSTAAFALMRKGHPVLNDDRILISKGENYLASATTDVIKLRGEALERFFPEFKSQRPLYLLDGDHYYKVSRAAGGVRWTGSAPVSCLVILERSGERNSSIEKIKSSQVVGELFPVTLNSYDPGTLQKKFFFLMDFLNAIDCYKVHFGIDMDGFSRVIEDIAGRY